MQHLSKLIEAASVMHRATANCMCSPLLGGIRRGVRLKFVDKVSGYFGDLRLDCLP